MAFITQPALEACLDVSETEPGHYTGPNLEMPYYRIFGGQLLAQMIAVATATDPDKSVKSLHVLFPREGDLSQPVDFVVARPHEGRTYASRSIEARQGDKVICIGTVSLHVDDEGPEAQIPMPEVVGPDQATDVDLNMVPWTCRAPADIDLEDPAAGPPEYYFWMRADPIRDDRFAHQALFAHATDLTVIGTALRPVEGLSQADSTQKIHTAVTSHTVWFHRPFRVDDWLLVHQTSPVVTRARGFGHGHGFTADGTLVASFAQESMIRPIPPS